MAKLIDITDSEQAELALEFAESIHILDGDLVVVDRSLDPKNGDFIVAYIDGEYTLKEFKMDESGECAWLIPHNPDFQPIRVDKNNEFTVWGVVTYAIHKTRL